MRWLLTLVVLLVGCGSCGEDQTSDNSEDPDVGVRMERDAPMGPCQGCIDESGACLEGKANDACGGGGTDCTVCEGETQCNDDGQCLVPPECSPDTCDGCCTADDECVEGTDDMACGMGGSRCSACPAEAACTGGQCVFACGPDNCNGCCDAAGECQTGDVDATCGGAGAACEDCTAAGSVCNGGACVATGCAQTCAGCCDGDACVDPPTAEQCGTAGAACTACGGGETCVGGTCEAPDDSLWDLVLISGDIAPSKLSGAGWDTSGGLPDVFAWTYAVDPNTGDSWLYETFVIEETLTPVWNEVVLDDVTTDALADGVSFELWDRDFAFDDEICIMDVQVDVAMASGQVVETTCDYDPLTRWRWRLEVAM